MKKLEQIKKLLKKLEVKSEKDLARLIPFGFEVKRIKNSTCKKIYINYKERVVVKANYEVDEMKRTGTKNIIKTIKYQLDEFVDHKEDFSYNSITIQPLCQPFPTIRQAQKAAEKLANELNYTDIHEGNVMLYRGRPVLIDW